MNTSSLRFILILIVFPLACAEPDSVAPATYSCSLSFSESSTTHPQSDRFQMALDEVAKNVPGTQVALRTSDGEAWAQAAGMADIANGVSMESCHKMMIGSISKVFTAVMIFSLQDEGLLSIEDPLSKWIAEEIVNELENADQVSLKQLLNHTSGLADYNNTQFNLDATNRPFMKLSQEEKLEYAYGESATHAPGTDYAYSNTNFVLLGMAAEAATGKSQASILQEYIFSPLNLTSAAYGTQEEPLPSGVVRPYVSIQEGTYFDSKHLEVADANTGDGGVALHMQDLRTFAEGLFGGKLLSEEAFDQMTTSTIGRSKDEQDYEDFTSESTGLGIDIYQTSYGEAYGHTGGIFGFNAYLLHFPERNSTLAIAYNGNEERGGDYKSDFRKEMLALMFE